ncbi:Zinc finger BED domain-containing protein 1 [Anabarilius grahami]|uniref:Zinc finger BED domain-containing protein 1 n=1 Tax=Anabarilius grahami TaxID=495550 RepID=A0A3N0ZB96_ANAGA|nr:Zinc finger BED domain-containing protein 1 [Anabarilius grahami]
MDRYVRTATSCSTETAAEFSDSILNMIVTDMRPLSMVEDDGFKSMIYTFNPKYELPSRPFLSKKYKCIKGKLKKALQETDSIAYIWTSVATEAYLGVTCHYLGEDWEMLSHCLTTTPLEERHTAANIAEWIEDVTAKFDIPPENIKAVVHDNGANVVAAAKILQERHRWASVRDAGHTLNLVVQSSLKIHQAISKCVAALVHKLKNNIQSPDLETAPVRSFQAHAKEQITARLQGLMEFTPESPNITLLAAALDPSFRKLKFLPADQVFEVQSTVQNMALAVAAKKQAWQPTESENGTSSTAHNSQKDQTPTTVMKKKSSS